MTRFAFVLMLAAGCSTAADDLCDEAAAKIATCFPDQATVAPTCDPAFAAEIASSSCDDLAHRDGKADGFTCFWMPWLCSSDGGSPGSTIEVSTEECGGGPDSLCPYVTGASCGLVTLHDDSGNEISRGFTSGGGRFTFSGLEKGSYRVKVHERSGSLARMMLDDLSTEQGPASIPIELDGSDKPWARFELAFGAADKIDQCADVSGGLTVKDGAGKAVDRKLVEWEWIIELESAGEVLERSRPLFIFPDKNVLGFRMLRPGAYTVRFVRMDIPEFERKPNPDYDRLRDRYAADVDPIEAKLTVSNADRNKTITLNRTITDPLR